MTETLEMTLQERLAVLAFAGKSAELLVDMDAMANPVNWAQLMALRLEAVKVLVRLDADWPTLLPLPHDGVSWKDRQEANDE